MAVMTRDAQTFTAAEPEWLLDWYRPLPHCHNVVPCDDALADRIALELAKLRARSAAPPSR